MNDASPVLCKVHFDGWSGRFAVPAELLGRCRRRGKDHYRVRLLESAGRSKPKGCVCFPPAFAVTFAPDPKENRL